MKKILLFILLCSYVQINYANLQSEPVDPIVDELEGLPVVFASSNYKDDYALNKSMLSSLLSVRLNVKATEESLENILDNISDETGAKFVYEKSVVNVDEVSCDFSKEKLQTILNHILKEHNIGYTVLNDEHIVLAHQKTLAKKTGSISGQVIDDQGNPLPGANIQVLENKFGAATCANGNFLIKNLKPGTYTVKASFIGYTEAIEKVTVVAGKKTQINFKLKSESFQIGGIQVVGSTELLPTDVASKTKISSGEIEHFQATSLGDVLDLVPGVQKSANPGLNKTSQVAIRGDQDDPLSAFGTLVVVDGVPQSNNANLQYESLSGSKFGGNTMGKGVDLRTIPADNIESVEVISGLPSVKYGDFTAGVIRLRTKIGARPTRIKIKNNPHTREGNIGGGYKIGKNALSYNFNIARSERDIRITGDEYTRYTGQVAYSSLMLNNKWHSNYKFTTQFINDEEEPQNDYSQTKNYNRGFSLGFNTWGKYVVQENATKWDYNAYVKMKKINSRKSRLVQSDLRVLPTGDTVSVYTGVMENKGLEWTAGGRLDYNNIFFTGDYIHKTLVGGQIQIDANTGDGLVFDTLYNPYGADSPRMPRKFDDIPGQTILSLYAEDKITGKLFVDFSLMFGFRYEMYTPQEFNFKGLWGDGDLVKSRQGSFFNPRLSLLIYLTKTNQFRVSVGKTSKSPPISSIYPAEYADTWRNPESGVVQRYRFDKTVEGLRGYQETQYEIGYDHKLFNKVGISVSAYYKDRDNQPTYGEPIPVFYEDPTSHNVYFINEYSLNANVGKYHSKGVEFSVRSSKIKALNMQFKVTGAYSFTKKPMVGTSFKINPDSSLGQYVNYQVPGVSKDTLIGWMYPSSGSWRDKIQLNYYVKYTHPTLGLWVTLRVEQLVEERDQKIGLIPVDRSKLTPEGIVSRDYLGSIKVKPVKWLFNINVSKSLFPGAEVSFYVNNFLDNPGIYGYYNGSTQRYTEVTRNPELFYGIEFSMVVDKLFSR